MQLHMVRVLFRVLAYLFLDTIVLPVDATMVVELARQLPARRARPLLLPSGSFGVSSTPLISLIISCSIIIISSLISLISFLFFLFCFFLYNF